MPVLRGPPAQAGAEAGAPRGRARGAAQRRRRPAAGSLRRRRRGGRRRRAPLRDLGRDRSAPPILLLVQKATGDPLGSFGGLVVPFDDQWWRLFTAPFAYVDVGYLFVVAVAPGDLRRPASSGASAASPTAVLLVACGALGMLAASGVAEAEGGFAVIAGGNGMALGAVAAWFAIRRAEAQRRDRRGLRPDRRRGRRRGPARAAALRLDRRRLRRPGRRRGRRPRRARRLGAAPVRIDASARLSISARPRRCPTRRASSSAAIERLTDAERFAEAERIVARAAPAAAEGAGRGAGRGRLVRRVARGRGAEGGDRPRPRRADRRGPRRCSPRRRGWG